MKKLLVILGLMVLLLSGCKNRETFAVQSLRNNAEVATAALDGGVDQTTALSVIAKSSEASANHLDPEQKIAPVTTAEKIIKAEKSRDPTEPNPELVKVYQHAKNGPAAGGWSWKAILGIGAVAVGVVGRMLGPPWNIAGTLIQTVAARCVPTYERDRKAAMGVIVSLETVLSQYGALLDTMPETKKQLVEKLGGKDPVDWMKSKLNSVQQDLGVHADVANVIDMLKKEVTTKDGVIAPAIAEFDKILSRKI